MAYFFGDGFDCYAATGDAVLGYWDSGGGFTLVAGRFVGSQAIQVSAGATVFLVKSSSATTDPVHHVVCAVRQTAVLSGSTLGVYFQFSDGSTNQCCVVFRSDGAMLLTSATPAGTVLDTYTGAVSAQNTWFTFEIEVVIGTSGSWAVRKNGNTSNDRATGSLNTRPGANTQANKLSIGMSGALNAQQLDDILWRSDASSVPWVGDIRCYTRMPASDASVQFGRSISSNTQAVLTNFSSVTYAAGQGLYGPFVAAFDGSITSITATTNAAYTGNIKCALFNSSGSVPTTVVASATNIVNNPALGTVTFSFAGATITKGTQYWIGFCGDSANLQWRVGVSNSGCWSTTSYASFPAASPATTVTQGVFGSVAYTVTTNNQMVNEPQQDGATSYVYDSNVSDQDFYTIAPLSGTPSSTVGVTTRGFLQKSDAGTRGAAVQLKSGASTVTSTPTLLSTSFGWLWRSDLVDPATGSAWSATGVNNCTIGPKVTS